MMTTEFTAADALLQEARAVIFDQESSSTALKIAGEKAIAAKSQYEAFSQTTLASRAAITIGTGSLGEIDAALDKVEMTAKVAARRAEMAGHIAAEGSRTGHQRAEVEAARKRGANAPLAARAEKLEIAVAAYPSAAKRIIQLLRADAGVRGAAQARFTTPRIFARRTALPVCLLRTLPSRPWRSPTCAKGSNCLASGRHVTMVFLTATGSTTATPIRSSTKKSLARSG